MRRVVAALAVCTLVAGCGAATPEKAPSASPPSSAPASASASAPVRLAAPPPPEFPIPAFPPAPKPVRIALPRGSTPYLHRIPTKQRVAFITIDDGYLKTPVAPRLIKAANVPVTLFLTTNAIRDNPEYFRPMLAHGAVIESHTVTHNNLRGRSYAFQRREICQSSDRLGKWYGRRPELFRPPFGNKDATTLRAARDCGIKAAFMWTETVDKGRVRYQVGRRVRPGDIILMHFRPAFEADFLAALNAIHRAGLTPARLQDYLPPAR